MKHRLFLFVMATALSWGAFFIYIHLGSEALESLEPAKGGKPGVFFFLILHTAAWFFYFYIGYKWVRYEIVSRRLRKYGVVMGLIAVISSMGLGSIVAGSAIFLMVYIFTVAPYQGSDA